MSSLIAYPTWDKSSWIHPLIQSCHWLLTFCTELTELLLVNGWVDLTTFNLCKIYTGKRTLVIIQFPSLFKVIHHIEALAKQLYDNENVNVPNGQNYSQRIPLPTDGHMSRVHQPVFPTLDPNLVSRIIEENHQNNVNTNNVHFSSSSQNKLVPLGQRLPGINTMWSKKPGIPEKNILN